MGRTGGGPESVAGLLLFARGRGEVDRCLGAGVTVGVGVGVRVGFGVGVNLLLFTPLSLLLFLNPD